MGPVRIVQRHARGGAAAGNNLCHSHVSLTQVNSFSQSLASGTVAKREDDPGLRGFI